MTMKDYKSDLAWEFRDVDYAAQSPAQKLDIYLPKGEPPFPVVLVVHGGAWLEGDKGIWEIETMLHALARGYAVASTNYRLSSEAIFPAQIFDVKAAIRHLRAHAGDYGFQPDRMCIFGSSAGGHLSALVGVSGGVAALEDLSMGNAEFSSTVQAVVDWFGPTDFLAMDSQLNSLGIVGDMHTKPDSPESKLVGKFISEAPELAAFASPLTYVTKGAPPFLIQHGRADGTVCCLQSVVLAEKLKLVAGADRVQLDLIDGAGHGGPQFETQSNISRMLDFIDMHLK